MKKCMYLCQALVLGTLFCSRIAAQENQEFPAGVQQGSQCYAGESKEKKPQVIKEISSQSPEDDGLHQLDVPAEMQQEVMARELNQDNSL